MFEFVVADHGIGALASLRSNPEFAELANSRDALPRVLQTGCTSTGDPERGRGFDDLFRGLANHNGDPVMRPSSATGKARPGTTAPGLGILKPSASRPSRARGSKPDHHHRHRHDDGIAPFAGAWIETLARSLALPRYRRLTIGPRSARHLRLSRLGYHVGVQC